MSKLSNVDRFRVVLYIAFGIYAATALTRGGIMTFFAVGTLILSIVAIVYTIYQGKKEQA